MFKKLKKKILDWLNRNKLKDTSSTAHITPEFIERTTLISQAKSDLKSLINSKQSQPIGKCQWGYDPLSHDIHFKVNKKQRRVEAKMKFKNSNEILAKSHSSCMKTDVFNSDLGKLIALYKLFNLPIPFKYLNAENPHVPLIHNVVEHHTSGNIFLVADKLSDYNKMLPVEVLKDKVFQNTNQGRLLEIRPHYLRVIDDSNDGDYKAYQE